MEADNSGVTCTLGTGASAGVGEDGHRVQQQAPGPSDEHSSDVWEDPETVECQF